MRQNNSFAGYVGTDDSFVLHVDLKGNGEMLRLLIIPNELDYVITTDGIHLCTIKHDCDDSWTLTDGHIKPEEVEKIGVAIKEHYKA